MLRITAEGDLRELAAFWQDMTETGRVSRSWSTGPDVHLVAEWPTNGGQELPLTEYEAANAAARAAQEQAQHMAECLDIQAKRIIQLERGLADLEKVDGTLTAAIEAATKGEDVGHLLLKASGDVRAIMIDLADDDEEE